MTLQELVHQAASLYLDKTAVCFDECNSQPPIYYTYKTVIHAASELLYFLRLHCDFQGIREIGLYCQPGINLPSWILGILQVPAAYAPIDPDSPPLLSTHFMQKCNLKYILVEKKQLDKFRSSYETLLNYDILAVEHNDLVFIRLHWKDVEVNLMLNDGKEKNEKRENCISSENSNEEKEYVDARHEDCLAYVLHTSGTTGTPKIVRVPHSCVLPNILHFRELFDITPKDVLFLASPLTFDPSVVEIFIALSSGASLLIVPTSVKVLPSKLAPVLFTCHRVTVLQATPTLLRRFGSQLVKSTVLSASTSLRVLALGGEPFPSLTVLKNWIGKGNKTQIFNIYGITEVSSWATFYRIPEKILNSTLKCELPVPLGFPLLGTVVEVRDADGFTIQEGSGQVFLGKVDVSELNKIYLDSVNLTQNKLSGKEDLWEKLQCLWKSTLSLPEDVKVPEDSLFLNSGGDSLKSVRLLSEIEQLVGTPIPGLLEVILNSSILEIHSYILQTVFAVEDLTFTKMYATKRKFSDTDEEEAIGKSLQQRSTLPFSYKDINAFIALSRGSQILSVNSTELGHYPLACSPDLISQTNIKNVKSSNPSALIGKSRGRSHVAKVSAEGNPVTKVEKMELCVRWRSDTGKCVDASPLVVIPAADNSSATVYIGSHSHRMKAVELRSGKVKWEQILGDRIESSACVSVCGNFIVVGCYNGLVYVLKSNSGETHWMFTTEDTVKSSATVDPTTGLVYIGSHDQHVYALDIYKKKCIWKLKCEGTVFSSPCLSLNPHHLYCATLGGLLLAVNPTTGNTVWKHCCGKPLFSSPRCCQQYICIGCVDGNLFCFTHSGEQVWQFSTSGPIFSSPCTSASEQEIFFGSHDCFIYCCNLKGHLQWKFETTSRVYATPFAFRNHNGNSEMLLAAASTDGKLWILGSESGQLQNVYELPGEVFSSPVIWESVLIIGCRNNYIYCLDLLSGTQN
ncbi:acyl-CoA synthetase family member 4 isoform X2 [Octodon degus]|uniref:Beta-alanine-activating enzyme n=1 Tax=Octodon degus TaxID=10160 RepID=A0A6P6E3K8_OCTDE|nr:acyl-CoA synthetase family member 4 isoform X2 [Octodon degus]